MKVKDNVSLFGLKPVMRIALVVLEKAFTEHRLDLVITSTTEGVHSAGSLHYYGLAIDIRNYWWDIMAKKKMEIIYKKISNALSDYFQIIKEKNHWHIELKDFNNYFANPFHYDRLINERMYICLKKLTIIN